MSILKKDTVGWWEQEIRKQGFSHWVEDVVVSLMLGIPKTDRVRQALVNLFEADYVDWYRGPLANWNDFMRRRGIRTSGPGEYEYDESIHFSFKDTVRLFKNNGVAGWEYEQFSIIFPGPSWDPEMHMAFAMDVNAPKWRAMIRQGLLRPASHGSSVTQDNICNVGGRFCQWSQSAFRTYLKDRFTDKEIKEICGDKLEYFDFRKYADDLLKRLRAEGRQDPGLYENIIIREWTRFQYISHLGIWGAMARDIKEQGKRMQGYVPGVWGNQGGHYFAGMSPYPVAESRLVDVVWLEVKMIQPFLSSFEGVSTLAYKVGRAAGAYHKPVWAVQWPQAVPNSGCLCEQIALAEAAAQGGIAYTPFGWRNMPEGGPGYLGTQGFLARWRSLFTHRAAYANVALVYPMSSLYWRDYMAPDGWRSSEGFTLAGYMGVAARILEDLHIPYEVVIFGHPDIWDGKDTFKRLARYKALILPGLEGLTGEQEKAIRAFAARGKTVIKCGPLGTRDENFQPRKELIPTGKEKRNWITVPEGKVRAYFHTRGKGHDNSPVVELEKTMQTVLDGLSLIKTSAPETVWVNAWLQEQGRRLSVHLVNYDVIVDKKKYGRIKKSPGPGGEEYAKPGYAQIRDVRNAQLRVWMPSSVKFDRVRLIPLQGQPIDLKYKSCEDGWVEVIVPRLHIWAIVVFTTGDELEISCEIARARRSMDRILVATGKSGPGSIQKAIESAGKSHARLELKKARKLAAGARETAQTALDNTIKLLVAAEQKKMDADLKLSDNAAIALDFGKGKAVPGWKKVGAKTMYDVRTGFGWVSKASITNGPVNKELDALHGTSLSGPGEAHFRVDLPGGLYEVTIIGGEAGYRHNKHSSHGEYGRNWIGDGDGWRLLGESMAPGKMSRRSFRTKVSNGHLLLRFYGTVRNPDQGIHYIDKPDWNIAGIAVCPVSKKVRPVPNLDGGTLRDWMLIGPFDDSACKGMDEKYPKMILNKSSFRPDREGRVAKRYHWTEKNRTGFAPVMLHEVMRPGEVFAYAGTRVFSPRAIAATLWFGSTGLAVVWINGKAVIVDKVASGLNADEFKVRIKLKRGMNELLVRVCAWWGDRWMFVASLTSSSGRVIPGLRGAAVGKEAGAERRSI